MKRNKYKDTYLSINIIKNMIAVKNGDEYNEVNVYTIIGIDLYGNRCILAIKEEKEDNRFFLDVFEQLKGKGINNIYFVIAPNEERLIKGLKISFNNSIFIDSLTMNLVSVLKWITYRGKYTLISKIKAFYIQDDYNKAYELIKYFKDDYKDNKLINKLFDKHFNNIEKYYNYDKVVREYLFNHRLYTDIYFKIYNLSKEQIYDNVEQAKTIINDNIIQIEKTKSYNKQGWLKVINHCSKYCDKILEKVVLNL